MNRMRPEWDFETLSNNIESLYIARIGQDYISLCDIGIAVILHSDGTWSAGPDGEG